MKHGTTRERVRVLLEGDPHGEMSDDAIAAQLGLSEASIQYHRAKLGIPSARVRRRGAPGARVARCAPCGKEYLAARDRATLACTGCGEWLRVEVVRE